MADKSDKLPGNAPGRFYVDSQCIACDACVVEAPKFFVMNDEQGHAFVSKQPEKDEEIDLCLEALRNCPIDAIGSDGNI